MGPSVLIVVALVVLIAVVIAAVIAALTRARRSVAGRVDPTQLLLDPELVGRVRALARANQKVAAITLLREGNPGLALGPAKVMVDRMARPDPPEPASGVYGR